MFIMIDQAIEILRKGEHFIAAALGQVIEAAFMSGITKYVIISKNLILSHIINNSEINCSRGLFHS